MLEALSGRDDFDRLLTSQITLPSKTHRQYLMRGLNSNDRADAIVSHYQWIDSLKNIALAHALTSPQEVPVVRFEAKTAKSIQSAPRPQVRPNAKAKARFGCTTMTIRCLPA